MKKKPLISVIVPVYNTEQYLRKCLNSICQQSLENIEIIVVNDGSTDNSLDIINEFAAIDSRVIIVNKSNGGLSSARNAGIRTAIGNYILHVDSDDWVEKDYCNDTYNFAIKEDLDIVLTDMYFDWGNTSKIVPSVSAECCNILNSKEYLLLWSENKVLSNACHRLIKRELYDSNGIEHPEHVSLGEDLVTTPRLAFYANNIGIINKAYYHYIQNPNSIMNSGVVFKIYEMLSVFDLLDNFFKSNKLDIKLNYLKATYYSTLIANNFDCTDLFFEKAINEYIILMKNNGLYNIKLKRGIKFNLISILFRINSTVEMFKFVRFCNIYSIKIKNAIK